MKVEGKGCPCWQDREVEDVAADLGETNNTESVEKGIKLNGRSILGATLKTMVGHL